MNTLKKQLFLILLFTSKTYAATLVVQENGPNGTYNSIQSAIDAATDGDVIQINNRPNNLPWIGNVSINKSLTLISAVTGQNFEVQGDYLVVPANNREITIIGMNNLVKKIHATTLGSAANRTKVNICGSQLYQISFVEGYNLMLASSKISNDLYFTFGHILGNELFRVSITSEQQLITEPVVVTGNKIINNASEASTVIYASGNSKISQLDIYNNYMERTMDGNGISVYGVLTLNVVNNHIQLPVSFPITSFGGTCLYFSNVTSEVNAINNYFYKGYRLVQYQSSPFVVFKYNRVSDAIPGINLDETNVTSSFSQQGNNLGNPANDYLDLDLSRNDIGVYGGSYSFDNFHPIENGKTSRVFFMEAPRTINAGTVFDVNAVGFSK